MQATHKTAWSTCNVLLSSFLQRLNRITLQALVYRVFNHADWPIKTRHSHSLCSNTDLYPLSSFLLCTFTHYWELSKFILWSGLSYVRALTICLLLVYFVSAAEWRHCFDFFVSLLKFSCFILFCTFVVLGYS